MANPEEERSQAESDYGQGLRRIPPMLHEMSETSRNVIASGYRDTMSNWRSKTLEARAKGNKGAKDLPDEYIDTLEDSDVGIEEAGQNVADLWSEMLDQSIAQPGSVAPGWYFGHRRRLNDVSSTHNLEQFDVIDSAASMSPTNSPDNEFRAVSAMADAVANRRMVTHPDFGTRRLSSMTPEEVDYVTGASQGDVVSGAKGFDLRGFRSGGTGKVGGWRTLNEPDYNAVDEMESTKVPVYAEVIGQSVPDSPLHHEYVDRLYDQQAARRVREAIEADQRMGVESPLRAVPYRIDLTGLKGVGTAHSFDHPILGTEGLAVPDTWMNAIESGQQLEDVESGPSPAKKIGSETSQTTVGIKGTTFMPPAEAYASGGKPLSSAAAHGIASIAAMQHGARIAREPLSETNIPPVMGQEMTWKFGRDKVANSMERLAEASGEHPNYTRLSALRKGQLLEESQFKGYQFDDPDFDPSEWDYVDPFDGASIRIIRNGD